MSTHAYIKIKGYSTCMLYKHYDGSPDCTLEWLQDFNMDFAEKRGVDADYKMAQLIRSSAWDADKYSLDDSRYTGWGVCPVYNDDEMYTYYLCDDGTVTHN